MQTRYVMEIAAIICGALSGVMHAWKRKYDVVGVVVMGISTSIGGGVIRDLLLGQGTVLAIKKPNYLIAVLSAVLIGMFFESLVLKAEKLLWVIDALAIGFFTVAGIQRALIFHIHILPAIILGIITAVCGGMIRDILARETPAILMPGQPYSLAALLAGITYITFSVLLDITPLISEMAAISSCFSLKLIAKKYDWNVPIAPDLFRKFIKPNSNEKSESKKKNDQQQ